MAGKHARVRILRWPTGVVAAGAVAVALVGAGAAGVVTFGTEPTANSAPALVDVTTPATPDGPVTTSPTPTPDAVTPTPTRSPERASRASSRPSPSQSRSATAKKPASKRPATSPTTRVVQTGSCGASYYDQGQVTANGESFNPNALTAAHKTLPFDTRVRVTNPDNGRSVVVRINDRGPFIEGRCIDLSRAGFEAIAALSLGAIDVRYEVLG
ncbi:MULTISPECIES: septal ring lytic transglycosylase RlpA family protein [unclassified Plantactinospora]|uniref:septal ring lytic transglycosylase RlpA family protein n=1 Tax=unclassified Plantactinospora TaxID=2631981 RepID=UPI000D163BF2|nr:MULTISPECIES: septal ring lytic transglycosylase RlpA family protein [unclassified Plantactinospora]AVT31097.1 septal ring lytic transglycosylase RlpA family lipoprotein [Plantactinospora sp. BC1]AVT40081.1 septal ring lytic transglycosylase RlpA family lipoprotein [Plantactinospora sp. BB1]